MDFNVVTQTKTKKFWWIDVLFYFAISLLVACVFCYIIFLIKNGIQSEEIKQADLTMQKVGTSDQKDQEKSVITYQKKINDFTQLLKNHQIASNVFTFMQTQTMPNVWFRQFSFNTKAGEVQLNGEADSLDAFSRQVASLEKNEYVQNMSGLNSSISSIDRVQFSFNLTLNPKAFDYLSKLSSVLQVETPAQSPTTANENAGQATSEVGTNQKFITSFRLLLNPDVIGTINQTNLTVTLNVPFGTDVKNLAPDIIVSPGAVSVPASRAPQNFTAPVTYRIIAIDGSTQDYKVTVNVLPKKGIVSSGGSSAVIMIIVIVLMVILVAGAIFFFVWKKMKAKKNNLVI